jgi:hypothetical protein
MIPTRRPGNPSIALTVSSETEISEKEILRDYAHEVRKNVKRARRAGLSVMFYERGNED